MITILATSQKQQKNFVLNHIWENKILIFFKNGHILHNGNNVVKDLMNIFLNSRRIHRYCKSI